MKSFKKYLRYGLNGLLVTGMIFVTGFLSFTGMLMLYNSVYFAICAFLLAGGIEGEVYSQNIGSSLYKMFKSEYWDDVILEQTLEKLLEHIDYLENPTFLKDYLEQKRLLEEMEEDDRVSSEEYDKAVERLDYMKRYFKAFIYESEEEAARNSKHKPFHSELRAALDLLGSEGSKEAIREQIAAKKFYSGLAWFLNIGAGISCFFVSLSVAQSSLTILGSYFGFAITGAALTASVFGMAIVGAVGYMLIIHNTITDMLKNETLREWANKISNFFTRKIDETQDNQPESLASYIARVVTGSLFVGLVVGLGIFATVATAGTWWYAAKAGAKLIPGIEYIASGLAGISVILMACTTLVFNVVNSLRSMKELLMISLANHWELAKKTMNKYIKVENLIQLLNPFRLISTLVAMPFKFAVFVGHLFSMGVMADNLEGINPLVTAFIVTVNEACQDGHYFLPEDDEIEADLGYNDESGNKYGLHLAKRLPVDRKALRNSFVITTYPSTRFYKIDAQGAEEEVFNSTETYETLAALQLQDYLSDDQQDRSIKNELDRGQLDALNEIIHSKGIPSDTTPGQPLAQQQHSHHQHSHDNHLHHHHDDCHHGKHEEKDISFPHHSHEGCEHSHVAPGSPTEESHQHHHEGHHPSHHGHHHGHSHGHGHEHGHHHHDHSHADLAGNFLHIVLFPLYCLVALWDWTASQFNSNPLDRLSLSQAFSKAFYGLVSPKPAIGAPVISHAWRKQEAQMKIIDFLEDNHPELTPDDQQEFLNLPNLKEIVIHPTEEIGLDSTQSPQHSPTLWGDINKTLRYAPTIQQVQGMHDSCLQQEPSSRSSSFGLSGEL